MEENTTENKYLLSISSKLLKIFRVLKISRTMKK